MTHERRPGPHTNNAESFLGFSSSSLPIARAPRIAALRTKESIEYKSREDISQHKTW